MRKRIFEGLKDSEGLSVSPAVFAYPESLSIVFPDRVVFLSTLKALEALGLEFYQDMPRKSSRRPEPMDYGYDD
jgi:hypothetical protein